MRKRHRLATDLHGPFKYNFFSSIKKLREAQSPLDGVYTVEMDRKGLR